MKIRSSFIGLSLLFLFTALTGCKKEKVSGGGEIISENRSANNFYNIKVDGNTALFVTGGTEYKVSVKGFENVVPRLKTVVENGTLKIHFEQGVNITNDNSEVYITMPSLGSIISNGNSNMEITGPFIGMDNFSLEKTGIGEMVIDKTSAKNFKLTLTGNASLKGFGLTSENAIVTIKGDGDTELTVTKNLNITLTGSGKIYYKGSPTVQSNIVGSGEVIKK